MGESTTYPVQNTDNIFDFINNWTKTVRTHSFKWGAEFRDLRLDRRQATGLGYGPRGTFAFNPGTTETKGGTYPSSTVFAHAFAAFLLGATDTTSRTYLTATPTNRTKYFATYFQDNWQATSKLSLNLGLRWELFTPVTPAHSGGASNYDPTTNNLLIAGVGGVGMSTGVQTDYKDFAPRVGAAYRITPKIVLRGGYAIGYYTGVSGYTGGTLSTQFPVVSNVLIGTANDNVVDGTFNSLPAVTTVPIPANGIINPPPAQSFYSVPFHNPLPYDQSINLTLQHELTPTTSIQYSFVSTIARRIPNDVSINAAPPGTGNTGRSLYALVGTQSITQRGYTSKQDYEAGQFFLNQRLSHNVQLTASYTWSKDREGANPPGSTARPNVYGLSTGDRTNIISVGHVVQLPFGKGQRYLSSRIGDALLGGIKINGILKKDSGTPFTVSADATSCNCPGNSQIADQIKSVNYLHGIGPNTPWFDTSAFVAPAPNRYGNSSTGAVRGPGFTDYDLSVLKRFEIRDRVSVEFRATSYNLTNTPQFANPGSTLSSTGFGIISATANSAGERQLEFGGRILF
jgi:TonB dependent receptor